MKSVTVPTRACSACGTLNMDTRYSCIRCDTPFRAAWTAPQQNKTLLAQTALHINERRHRRLKIELTGIMMEGEGIYRHPVTGYDITPAGMRVLSTLSCQAGARVHLHLPARQGYITAEGIVRRCRRDNAQDKYSVGIQFIEEVTALSSMLAGLEG